MIYSIIQYIQKIGIDLPDYVIGSVLILIVLIVLWILLRGVRLKYWKVDKSLAKLDSIENKIDGLKEGLEQKLLELDKPAAVKAEAQDEARRSKPEIAEAKNPDPQRKVQEEKPVVPKPEIKAESAAERRREVLFCVGKSGRIYTETELEVLIRD